MRNIYGKGFYLIAIHSSEKNREEFLRTDCSIIDQSKRRTLIERDRDENIGYGQSTRDAFHLADFFLSETGNIKKTKNWLTRFLDLVFGDPFRTPTFNEFAMFMAYAASMRSADLSRQVGAIITKMEDIISNGANECPRAFGGTYWPIYDEISGEISDHPEGRDHTRGEDRNAREKEEIVSALRAGLSPAARTIIDKNIKSSGLADITEFGRVVHAEMDALLGCARRGVGCEGASLYCTTFPCHNCAKHIIASGIREVIYVEPYPKSKALDMHGDSIATFEKRVEGKLVFKSFVGVGPRQFVNLFSMSLSAGGSLSRKEKPGYRKAKWDRKNSVPRVKMFESSHIENEKIAYSQAVKNISRVSRNTKKQGGNSGSRIAVKGPVRQRKS